MLNLISVYDRATQAYMPPFCVQHNGQAIRSFSDECKTPSENNNLGKHPDDFELYLVGSFDEFTGTIQNANIPQLLITGTQVKNSTS